MQIKDGFKGKGKIKIPDDFDLNALAEEEVVEMKAEELDHCFKLFISFLDLSKDDKHPQMILEIPKEVRKWRS